MEKNLKTRFFKFEHYKKLYPKYNVTYIYFISDYFKQNCPAGIVSLIDNGILVF